MILRARTFYHALQSTLFGFANQKCADFVATQHRITLMDKVRTDMSEQCGAEPDDDILAGALAPALVPSSVYELAFFRKENTQKVDKSARLH